MPDYSDHSYINKKKGSISRKGEKCISRFALLAICNECREGQTFARPSMCIDKTIVWERKRE